MVPLTVFFGTETFFRKQKIFPLSIFWCFATDWMLENPKGSPLTVFFGTETFFRKQKIFPLSIFWCFATDWMLKNPKGSPLTVFFGTETFFRKQKNFPLSIFWCFATDWMLENPKGSPLTVFFGTETFFRKQKIFPLSIFWCFATDWMLKNPKGSPFSFSALWDFSAPLGPFFWVCNFFEYFFSKNFRFSSTVKENTWHLEVFSLFLSLGYGADLGRSRLVFFHFVFQCICYMYYPGYSLPSDKLICQNYSRVSFSQISNRRYWKSVKWL